MTAMLASARGPRTGVIGKLRRLNWWIITSLTVLALIGVAMHTSVSSGDATALKPLTHGLRYAALLFIAIAVALFVPPRSWYLIAYPLYATTMLLLIGVELVGETRMGATRWLAVGPVSLQPSEIMKVAIVLALARYYEDLKPGRAVTLLWSIPALFLIGAPVALVMHQPDLGTATLIAMAGLAVMFLAGLRWRYIIVAMGVAAASAVGAYYFALHDYQRARINVFLGLADDPLGEGYHVLQSKIAIGSAGLTGAGWRQGSQSQGDFLPEKDTDFIFTMIVEEFGFLGGFVVVAIFAFLLWKAVEVATRARTMFGALASAGVAATLSCYVLINTAMVTGLVPVVGIPLPLISYGGTAMVTIMAGFAIVLSIDLHRDQTGARGILW
ncbi:MAG: rod shape-determining protein RodA [Hydrogenophilaceae bacterium]|jgi:rod shape determining protein RodA|nr:rod shape-determining protein RodA [Hydrogenophilaceae bacterium]